MVENNEQLPKPSSLWYLGHIFIGIVSGLICYLLWHEKNKKAAKRHLIASIILSFVPALIIMAILGAILAAQFSALPPGFF
ncbi:MAG: hypothetical protein EB829_04220 [Nitrosopumilus sp. H8]|nr:MAG: hypothetical protein EB829_04220 [Nitrosopumilus sp. H8]